MQLFRCGVLPALLSQELESGGGSYGILIIRPIWRLKNVVESGRPSLEPSVGQDLQGLTSGVVRVQELFEVVTTDTRTPSMTVRSFGVCILVIGFDSGWCRELDMCTSVCRPSCSMPPVQFADPVTRQRLFAAGAKAVNPTIYMVSSLIRIPAWSGAGDTRLWMNNQHRGIPQKKSRS